MPPYHLRFRKQKTLKKHSKLNPFQSFYPYITNKKPTNQQLDKQKILIKLCTLFKEVTQHGG